MSSGSNTTRAAIRSSASISTMLKHIDVERLGLAGRDPNTDTTRGRGARPRVAMTVDVMFVTPMSAVARMIRDLGIATVSDPGAHHPPTIVAANVVGQHLGHRVPVARREVRQEALVHWLAAFSSRGAGRLSSSNLASAASMSCLVEYFAAVDQVAFDRHEVDLRHSASKPSCEVPCAD